MQIIGVKGFFLPENDFTSIKRDLLFFDKLALFVPPKEANEKHESSESKAFFEQLDWLIENQLIIDRSIETFFPSIESLGSDYKDNLMFGVSQLCELLFGLVSSNILKEVLKDGNKRQEVLIELRKSGNGPLNLNSLETALEELKRVFRDTIIPHFTEKGYVAPVKLDGNKIENFLIESVVASNDFLIRAESIRLTTIEGISAIPLLSGKGSFTDKFKNRKAEVVQIVFNNIPFPNEDTPWEQILDFKRDSESINKRLALRNWITDMSTSQYSILEVEEKLEYLLNMYEEHIKLHKIKYHKGILETIVTTSAEFAENLAKLKLSKIAKIAFSLKSQKIGLLEEEMKGPGCEVAYISHIRNEISS